MIDKIPRLEDSEPKRAYYAEKCVKYDAHVMMGFRKRKSIGGSSIKRTRNKTGWYPLDTVVLRDSEPKRAYDAKGCFRHCAHVMMDFRLRKSIGGSSIKGTRNKTGWYPLDTTLFCLACLEGLEPPTFWFVAKHSIRLS